MRSCTRVMYVTQSASGNKSHRRDCLRDFHICPLPEIDGDNFTFLASETFVPSTEYKASDVDRASLNN